MSHALARAQAQTQTQTQAKAQTRLSANARYYLICTRVGVCGIAEKRSQRSNAHDPW
jgi:hypothetical protein